MGRRRERAVILVLGGIEQRRQEKALLAYIRAAGYRLDSVTSSGRAALALVAAGLAEVVVVAVQRPSTVELAEQVEALGGRVEATRRALGYSPNERRALAIRAALARGATPEQIALVLDIELAEVSGALSEASTDIRLARLR